MAVPHVSPLLAASFTSKTIATLSLKPVGPLYCLRCNFVERNIYSDTEAGYYISSLHCWKDACCATRKPEELPVIATGYTLPAYVLKLVLGSIYFCYTVLLDLICTLTINFWIS